MRNGRILQQAVREKIPAGLLTSGFLDGIVPLPKLPGRIPPMVANLKRLKLIPLSHITANSADYVRIAAIDSPFRELVSWAYSQTACRPGLPDRDTETWTNEMIAEFNQTGGDGE
jgi:CTP synthase